MLFGWRGSAQESYGKGTFLGYGSDLNPCSARSCPRWCLGFVLTSKAGSPASGCLSACVCVEQGLFLGCPDGCSHPRRWEGCAVCGRSPPWCACSFRYLPSFSVSGQVLSLSSIPYLNLSPFFVPLSWQLYIKQDENCNWIHLFWRVLAPLNS